MNHQRLLPGYDNLTYPAHPSGHPQDQAHGSEHFDQEIPPQSFDSMGQAPHGFYQYGQPTHSVVSQLYGYGYPPGPLENYNGMNYFPQPDLVNNVYFPQPRPHTPPHHLSHPQQQQIVAHPQTLAQPPSSGPDPDPHPIPRVHQSVFHADPAHEGSHPQPMNSNGPRGLEEGKRQRLMEQMAKQNLSKSYSRSRSKTEEEKERDKRKGPRLLVSYGRNTEEKDKEMLSRYGLADRFVTEDPRKYYGENNNARNPRNARKKGKQGRRS